MKAAVTNGDGTVRLAEVPRPEPGDYECLCRIAACATCTGTDQKLIAGAMPYETHYPAVLGHESVGRVVARGRNVRHIRDGAVFLRPMAVYPGGKLGDYHSLWGGFAEYGLVTDVRALAEDRPDASARHATRYQQRVPSDPAISASDATILITLKEIATFLVNVGVRFNASAVVLGSGPVAMAICFVSKLMGLSPVIVVGRRAEPLARCRAVGADFTINTRQEDMVGRVQQITDRAGVDFVFDAAGSEELIAKAGALLASGGKLAVYAIGESAHYTLDRFGGPSAWDLCFSGPSEERGHDYVLGLARLNAIPFAAFYSHTMPFAELEQGFALLKQKKASKIVFEMKKG